MIYTDEDYLSMKTPFSYQISEFDCGTTCVLNAIRYLLKRGEVPPILIKTIQNYTLDTINKDMHLGENGTSVNAMKFLSNWINEETKKLKVKLVSEIIEGKDANMENVKLKEYIDNGGIALLRVWDEDKHYVLCTKIDNKSVYLFDPYYCNEDDFEDDAKVIVVLNKPFEYNRVVSKSRFNEDSKNTFSIVKDSEQMIMLINRE